MSDLVVFKFIQLEWKSEPYGWYQCRAWETQTLISKHDHHLKTKCCSWLRVYIPTIMWNAVFRFSSIDFKYQCVVIDLKVAFARTSVG